MSNNISGERNPWCIMLSGVIIAFVVGYTTGWYNYNKPKSNMVPRAVPQSAVRSAPPVATPPKQQPGPGSERFYNSLDSQKIDDSDHDQQVINRMKKS